MKKMRALGSNVIVSRIAGAKTTESGIILRSSDGPDKARIEVLGPDVTEVEVGEIALVNWNKASPIEDDTYLININEVVFIYED
jgi:co-chaperonin GroES (HSP10)